MSLFFLDFESRSEVDLPSVGAYRYAEDPSTELICAAYASDDAEVGLWRPKEEPNEILVASLFPNTVFVAHNAEFEKSMLREILHIDLPIDRFIDTAAMSARMSLPRKLEDLAHFFGLDTSAKDEGKKAINALSKPRRPTKSDPSKWTTREARPDLFEMLDARCKQDVDLTRTIYHKLLELEAKEREIWQVTIAMNERGLLIDRDSIPVAHALLEADEAPQVEEFLRIAGCKVKSYARVAERCGLPDVRKPTVRKALRDPKTPPDVHRILSIYQALSKSSVAKLDAMLDRMNGDARVRGSFVYCGAERTARWSASGIQPQNFPRGLGGETELAFRALHSGLLPTLFEGCPRPSPEPPLSVTSTIANILRGFIVAPPGKVLIVGDLAQIEARSLNWLAGQEDTIQLFATGGDPYCAMASRIYGREVTKKQKDERFMGKQAVLGAGYGLGANGFQFMLDDTYDVQISEEFAKQVVTAYREASPKVVAFWKRLNDGFVHAVAAKKERVRVTRNIWTGYTEIAGVPYAYIEIPSGRKLYYATPELVSTPRGPAVAYFGRDRYSKGWGPVRTYGGKIAENVTQAFSRDVLAGGMLRLAAEFDLTGTVHDETIAETTPDNIEDKIQRFHDLMTQGEPWAEGLPLECEVFVSARYRK
jgi:DNA polymerase